MSPLLPAIQIIADSLAVQIPYNKGVTWPDLVVGVVAAILLASGLVPPYFELWKRDGRVIGFSEYLVVSYRD